MTLFVESDSDFSDSESECDDSEPLASASRQNPYFDTDYTPSPQKKSAYIPLQQELTLDQMRKIVEEYEKYGLKYILNRYKKLKSDHKKFYRMKNFVESCGNRPSKINELKNGLYTKFINQRTRLASIHDWNLEIWAKEINADLKIENFKASHSFIHNFKKKYRISSRKITKFYTKKRELTKKKYTTMRCHLLNK